MQRYSTLWWASILLSSVVTGGGSFVVLSLLTELPLEAVIVASVVLTLAGDVVLALLMEAVSPTYVTIGPGERWHDTEKPMDLGTAISDFEDRCGKVSIRGETWLARQTAGCSARLQAGTIVRVVERDGLTLVVAASDSPTCVSTCRDCRSGVTCPNQNAGAVSRGGASIARCL